MKKFQVTYVMVDGVKVRYIRRRGCRPAPDLLQLYHRLVPKFPVWAQKGLPSNPIIMWNIGMSHCGGYCRYHRSEGRLVKWIEVSALYPRSEDEHTLLHEMCHLVLAPGVGHGLAFKALLGVVGGKSRTTVEGYRHATAMKQQRRNRR